MFDILFFIANSNITSQNEQDRFLYHVHYQVPQELQANQQLYTPHQPSFYYYPQGYERQPVSQPFFANQSTNNQKFQTISNSTDKNSLSGLKNIFPDLSQVVTPGHDVGSMSSIGIPNQISSTGSKSITQKPKTEFKNLTSPFLQQSFVSRLTDTKVSQGKQQENTRTQPNILAKAEVSIDDIKLEESAPESKNNTEQQWKVNPSLDQNIISKFGGGSEDKNQEYKTDKISSAVKQYLSQNAYQDQNFVDKTEGGTQYRLQENKYGENQGMNRIISATGSFDLNFERTKSKLI